jgi:ABC-type transport system substrate-binding protein
MRPWWTRRDFLQRSAAVAAGAYGMRWGLADAAEIPLEFDGSKFQLAALEPNPKRGGVLRMGIPLRPPHFDVHQSGTIFNLGSQGCMFDNLIRRDPRNGGKTIIPDLAHSWEIAKDGKIYTFHLHLPPAPRRAVPRRRRIDRGGCQSDVRPHR